MCFADEQSDALRRSRNCEAETNPSATWAFDPSLRRCPVSQMGQYERAMLDSWAEWKLTQATPWGGLMDAPQWYTDGIIVMESEHRRCEAERTARER